MADLRQGCRSWGVTWCVIALIDLLADDGKQAYYATFIGQCIFQEAILDFVDCVIDLQVAQGVSIIIRNECDRVEFLE